MLIRPLGANEKESLSGFSSCFETSPYVFDPRVQALSRGRYQPVFMKDLLALPDTLCYGAELDGRITGFVLASENRVLSQAAGAPTASILLLAVLPEWRGRGLGKALVQEVLQTLREKDSLLVTVGTDAPNIPAIRTYESCGFQTAQAWQILRYFPTANPLPPSAFSLTLIPPLELETGNFRFTRPLSYRTESGLDQEGLHRYLLKNLTSSCRAGRACCWRPAGDHENWLTVTREEMTRRTLGLDLPVYKILDFHLNGKEPEWGMEFLRAVLRASGPFSLFELWLDARMAGEIVSAAMAGFSLSYGGISLHKRF